jgi:hypothetical protein
MACYAVMGMALMLSQLVPKDNFPESANLYKQMLKKKP